VVTAPVLPLDARRFSAAYRVPPTRQDVPANPGSPHKQSFTNREALFADFQPLVRRLIRQYGDTPECREDLAGEIYYRFCTILEAYDPERGIPLRPYIVRQLTASVYTYARHGWIRKRRETSYEEKAAICEPVRPEDPTSDWDDKLNTDSLVKGLPEAILKLPQRQRNVLIWRYYDQKSFEEIAKMLGIQVATARSLLRHALNGLRRHMADAIEANNQQ
jgi:RNA polymerase sigma factor (sigma-70 family)